MPSHLAQATSAKAHSRGAVHFARDRLRRMERKLATSSATSHSSTAPIAIETLSPASHDRF